MLFQNFYENRKGHVGKLCYSFKIVEPINLEKSLRSLPESAIQIRRDGREWMLTNRHNEKFIIEYNHSYYIIFIKSGYSILNQRILWFQNHYFKLIFSCVNIKQLLPILINLFYNIFTYFEVQFVLVKIFHLLLRRNKTLRVNVSKNKNFNKGYKRVRKSGWFLHILFSFSRWFSWCYSFFIKNDRMQDYGSLKFWQIRPQKKIHNFLISEPNRTRFSALDSPWKTLQIM